MSVMFMRLSEKALKEYIKRKSVLLRKLHIRAEYSDRRLQKKAVKRLNPISFSHFLGSNVKMMLKLFSEI